MLGEGEVLVNRGHNIFVCPNCPLNSCIYLVLEYSQVVVLKLKLGKRQKNEKWKRQGGIHRLNLGPAETSFPSKMAQLIIVASSGVEVEAGD